LYSSIETKALETSIYLAKPNGIKIIPNDQLVEVTSITNKIFPEFEKYARDYFEGRVERWNEGESMIEALERFKKGLQQIVDSEKVRGTNNIGILSHGSVYTLFTKDYCEKPIWDLHKSIKMPDIAEYDWEKKQFISLWRSWNTES